MKPSGLYTKEVMKYFKNPKNMGRIENADGVGKAGNLLCGDIMVIYIKVKNNRIKDVRFETFGCVVAISTSSMVTELAKNKTIDEALKITKGDIATALGNLPPIKMHCSVLAADALDEAIYDYLSKNKLSISTELAKRHERIQRETNIIEERHKDYINLEKEIWKIKGE